MGSAMNRLIAVFVLSVTSVFWLCTIPCHAQTFDFITDDPNPTGVDLGGEAFATIVLFNLPASEPSDFGEFAVNDLIFGDLGGGTFNNLIGEVLLEDGVLRSANGEAILFDGDGAFPDFGDPSISFQGDSSSATYEFLTFGVTGRFVLAVPEPSSTILMLVSALSLGTARRRK